ncbi:THAP domain-containing protein 4 [Mycetomoellerius zeteki]|uniref:THAP domain-containing protein 4 n=1 Tax=Mycetomoellerius zeteki TaxID=64791 RepID=UPI00084E8596|nr:PREDICTED: THAP domain-containing protein 4-like [Trachymyrmex zeteki]
MPGCCIENCKNRSEKGFRLFRVPTGDRRKEWLQLIGKETLPERAVICEVHFDNNQFENNRQDGRKLLRPFSKPNLLLKHTAEDKDNKDEEENNSRNSEFSSQNMEFRRNVQT